jgi:hypothetical protein
MEVHSHAHTERKKWYHYLWEFFMLFLAVTLGFFVENQREHFIEHKRENQYMRSMVEDLKTDTAELDNSLINITTRIRNIDSMLLLLVNNPVTNEELITSYRFTFPALSKIPIVFTDRTITQLKNSGNMRIIQNQKVTDALINYWNHIAIINEFINRYNVYREKARDLETRIFNTAEIYLKNNGSIKESASEVHLVEHPPGLVKEYANTIAYCGVILNPGFLEMIKEQNGRAIKLIGLIQKEYHLKNENNKSTF